MVGDKARIEETDGTFYFDILLVSYNWHYKGQPGPATVNP